MKKSLGTRGKDFAASMIVAFIAILLCFMLTSCDEETSKTDSDTSSVSETQNETDSEVTENQTEDYASKMQEMEEKRANPPIPLIEGCSLLESYYLSIAGNETIEELQQRAEACGLYAYSYDGGASFYDLQVAMSHYTGTNYGSEQYEFSGDSIWITYDTGLSRFWHGTYNISGGPYSVQIDGSRSDAVRYQVMKGVYAVDPAAQYSSTYEALTAARALA